MIEQMQRCFDAWREAHADGEPTLRQELAYRDGFADALKALHACSTMVLIGDQRQPAGLTSEADWFELA